MFSMFSLKCLRINAFNCIKNRHKFGLNLNTKQTNVSQNIQILNKCLSTEEKKSNEDQFEYELPLLMKFLPKGMPNVLYTIRNHLIINFYLKPFIDKEFQLKSFLNGSKQALTVISSHLANDDIESVKEMVTKEAFEEISKNYPKYSLTQKNKLKIDLEDIILTFAYNIDIKRQSPDVAIVKIFVVFDCFPGFQEIIKEEMNNKNLKFFDFTKYLDRKCLCNYEFIREYIKGVQTQWIVSKLMHIKDKDILKMYGFYE